MTRYARYIIPLMVPILAALFLNLPAINSSASFEERISKAIESGLANKKFVGLSVLVIQQDGSLFKKHFGYRDIEKKLVADDSTLYELGSITKAFAKLALASQNEIQMDDPMSKHLPQGIRIPKPGGEEITISQLVTHTGIKFSVPCTIRLSDPENLICYGVDLSGSLVDPYQNTTREKLYDFISEFSYTVEEFPQLFPKPGTFYSYSNVGVGLLGELLAKAHGGSFESFLTRSVLDPLGMENSKIAMPCENDDSCENFVQVYHKETPSEEWTLRTPWHLPGMSAAGGLRSNLKDMERFLLAQLKPENSPIRSAVEQSQSPLPTITQQHNRNICDKDQTPAVDNCNASKKTYYYGWEATPPPTVFYQGGATAASQAMIMFSKDRSIGVVVLSNSTVGKGEASLYHYPNDVALCVFQLLGQPITETDFCEKIAN